MGIGRNGLAARVHVQSSDRRLERIVVRKQCAKPTDADVLGRLAEAALVVHHLREDLDCSDKVEEDLLREHLPLMGIRSEEVATIQGREVVDPSTGERQALAYVISRDHELSVTPAAGLRDRRDAASSARGV
jgi:hypothetical protein